MKDQRTRVPRGSENGGKLSERGFSYPLEGGGFCLLELRSLNRLFLLCFTFFTCFPLVPSLPQMLENGAIDRKM